MKSLNTEIKEAVALSANEVRKAAPVVPLMYEPPARLFVDPALPEPLTFGRVVIQYRTENIRILPVYGTAALEVSPRIGHLHVTIDSEPWHWLDASGEPLTLNGFSPGEHSILIELADPVHKIIDHQIITFIIPGPTDKNLVTSFLEKLAIKDANGMAALFADDIDWYVGGNPNLPWTGPRSKGKEVAEYFNTMWPYFEDGKSDATIEKIITSGDNTVITGTLTHTAASTGQSFTTPVAMHLTIADGKINRLHLYEDTWIVSKAFTG